MNTQGAMARLIWITENQLPMFKDFFAMPQADVECIVDLLLAMSSSLEL